MKPIKTAMTIFKALILDKNTNKIKNLKNINDFYKVLENQNIQTYDINISKA